MDLTHAPESVGVPTTTRDEFAENAISLDLRTHQIGYIVPPNSLVRGELLLSTGALIVGSFCGRLVCSSGAVIIKHGAVFEGEIEADQVWIDGEVRPVSAPTAQMLSLLSRSTPSGASGAIAGLATTYKQRLAEGDMSRIVGRDAVAISNAAAGKADVASKSFAAHSSKFAARYLPLQQGIAGA